MPRCTPPGRLHRPARGVGLPTPAPGRGEHEEGIGRTATEGALIGGLVGYALALSIDMATAWTDVEPERPPPAAPMVMIGSSSATVGLAGSF